MMTLCVANTTPLMWFEDFMHLTGDDIRACWFELEAEPDLHIKATITRFYVNKLRLEEADVVIVYLLFCHRPGAQPVSFSVYQES